jgi:hypothetical protein
MYGVMTAAHATGVIIITLGLFTHVRLWVLYLAVSEAEHSTLGFPSHRMSLLRVHKISQYESLDPAAPYSAVQCSKLANVALGPGTSIPRPAESARQSARRTWKYIFTF